MGTGLTPLRTMRFAQAKRPERAKGTTSKARNADLKPLDSQLHFYAKVDIESHTLRDERH